MRFYREAMHWVCSRCGSLVLTGLSYCTNCGKDRKILG